MVLTTVEPGRRIRLPSDWADELGLGDTAALAKTPDGILVKPCDKPTWGEIFAQKLRVGSRSEGADAEEADSDAAFL